MSINGLLSTVGYPAVFALVVAESLGIPLPGETVLIAAGVYAGTTQRLSPWVIFGLAAAAAVIGDNAGYAVGTTGGHRVLRRYGRYVRLDEHRLKVGRYVFDRQGGKVVFFGRFVSVLRTYAAFLAGANKMWWRRFVVANGAGGVCWAAIYTFVPYEVGGSVRGASGVVDVAVAAVAVVVVVTALVIVRRRMDQLSEQAEAAYPGPLPRS